jgi:hypothetical protein
MVLTGCQRNKRIMTNKEMNIYAELSFLAGDNYTGNRMLVEGEQRRAKAT